VHLKRRLEGIEQVMRVWDSGRKMGIFLPVSVADDSKTSEILQVMRDLESLVEELRGTAARQLDNLADAEAEVKSIHPKP
jgi:hypothetical protein